MIRLENVTYTYPFGENPAVRNVTLDVAPGEVVLVTGVSGCGKSTLVRLVNGMIPEALGGRVEGRITVAGKDNAGRGIHEIARDVGTLFQDPESQFFALGVDDELAFALQWQGVPPDEVARKVGSQAAKYGISHILRHTIDELSEGQKQKVGLAAVTLEPLKGLVLDEPTANLDPEATASLACEIARLKAEGMAILVADHRLYWLRDVADRVVVMDKGCVAAQGDFGILTPELCAQYGLRNPRVADCRATLPAACGGDRPVLQATDLTFAYKGCEPIYRGAALAVGAGVTAVIGDNGTGKTTLARILCGLNKAQGHFRVAGRDLEQKELLGRVAVVLQNADHQLHMKTVLDEVLVSLAAAGCRGGEEAARELLAKFALSAFAQRHPQSLSGGQKQRLVIACAFAKKPDIIILDEPTSGLDGRNMHRTAQALRELADSGKAVLVITHDLELLSLCCSSAVRLPLAAAQPISTKEKQA